MKALNPNCQSSSKIQTLLRRSADFCAIALNNNRAAPGGHKNLFEEICAPTCLAALLFATIPAANADNLGRLFFTPAQRAQLDYNYARNAPAEGNSSSVLTVNGIVQKNGGARTVWVNGVAQSVGKNNEGTATTQTVTIPGKSHPVKIKVGQKILLDQPAATKQDTPVE